MRSLHVALLVGLVFPEVCFGFVYSYHHRKQSETRAPVLSLTGHLLSNSQGSQRRTTKGYLRVPSRRIAGCKAVDDLLLCEGLPDLGDGACAQRDLDNILATLHHPGWHGDKTQVIRSEAPGGWLAVPSLLHKDPHLAAPSSAWQTVHARGIHMMDGFMTNQEADFIAAHIQSQTPISSEVTQPSLHTCGFRRSTTWVFFGDARQQSPMPHDFLARIEDATGVSRKHYEPSQVVKYLNGDFFSDHYDDSPCDHIGSNILKEVKNANPRQSISCDDRFRRQATLLVYLTGEEAGQGGATYFPKLDVRVKPKKGRAIFFRPTRADGSSDPLMLHSAETLLAGKKFVLQQWIMHGTEFQ